MPKPGSTQVTVGIDVREMFEEIAAEETVKREVNVTVPSLLRLIATKIKSGEIKL